MIYTSNYKTMEHSDFKTISISKDKGEDAGYKGDVNMNVTDVGPMDLQIGANEGQYMTVRIPATDTEHMYIDDVDVINEDLGIEKSAFSVPKKSRRWSPGSKTA